MSIHGSEGKENEIWQRFHEHFMSAIILEREVLNVWNDCGILNSIVHDRVVSGLVVTLEQAVKQEWPALKSLLRSINLVAKSFFQ